MCFSSTLQMGCCCYCGHPLMGKYCDFIIHCQTSLYLVLYTGSLKYRAHNMTSFIYYVFSLSNRDQNKNVQKLNSNKYHSEISRAITSTLGAPSLTLSWLQGLNLWTNRFALAASESRTVRKESHRIGETVTVKRLWRQARSRVVGVRPFKVTARRPEIATADSPEMGLSGFEASFLQSGTKTVTSRCPRFKNQSTQILMPLHENLSLLPWLMATLLPSMTIGKNSVSATPSSILMEDELPRSSECCFDSGELAPSEGFDFWSFISSSRIWKIKVGVRS